MPDSFNLPIFKEWFTHLHKAIEAKEIYHKLKLKTNFSTNSDHREFISNWEKLIGIANAYQKEQKVWLNHLTTSQTERIIQDKTFAEDLQTSLKKDFDFLKEMDELENKLAPYEKHLCKSFYPRSQQMETKHLKYLRIAFTCNG